MASKKTRERKYELADQLTEHLGNYTKCFVVEVDNVGSNQLHEIRKAMRGDALIYCGKNTQMRRCVRKYCENNPGSPWEALIPKFSLNIGLVFTNGDLAKIRDQITANKMPAPAKAGSTAQVDVVIPAGPTALEPSLTSFLQALNISSKITKGNIEIINEVTLFKQGDRVDASQAALLQKLDILPFEFGLVPISVYDNGSVFSVAVLDISNDQIVNSLSEGIKKLAGVAMATNTPCAASLPFSFLYAFKNALALSVEVDYKFKENENVYKYLADPSAFASAGGGASSSAGATSSGAAAAAVEEEEEEEEIVAAAGLFDDGGGADY